MHALPLYLPAELFNKLQEIKGKRGVSINSIIREAITEFLDREEEREALHRFIIENFGHNSEPKEILKRLIEEVSKKGGKDATKYK